MGRVLWPIVMADAPFCDLPTVQVLLDLRQRGIRWQVLLGLRSRVAPVVRLEKRGKGDRLLHSEQARRWPLSSASFLHPREQVAGGPILPRWLIERVELLDRDLGAQCSQT